MFRTPFGKVRILNYAWSQGIYDGFREPWGITSGMTWDDFDQANEVYDMGATVGEVLSRLFFRIPPRESRR